LLNVGCTPCTGSSANGCCACAYAREQRSRCLARNCTRNRIRLQSQWLRFACVFRRSATALVWAAAFGRAAVAELLLAKGADVNAELTGGCVGYAAYTVGWLRRILGKRANCVSTADGDRGTAGTTLSRPLKQDTFDPIYLTLLFQSNRSSIFIAPMELDLSTSYRSVFLSIRSL
jgi:hypothetical protein